MGHFYSTVIGQGKTKQEAQRNAIDEFLFENGNRHNVRDVSKAHFIEKVPPMGVVTRTGNNVRYDYTKPNLEAPQSEWLEKWEFELHTHA